MNWHLQDRAAVLKEQVSDTLSGLSTAEAELRLKSFGRNELHDTGGTSPWRILREQFTSTMSLLLIGAAMISGLVGSFRDSVTILAIVCLFALLGFVQEYRAERAIQTLKRLAVPNVRVRRNGADIELPAAELVPGDILLLEAGNSVPADCRLIESFNLRVQEAILTGEAEAVEKTVEALTGRDLPLGDRKNMVFRGTTISYGRGVALAVATGMETELGRIAMLLQEVAREWTPLQCRLDRLGKVLAVVAVAVSLVVFAVGMLRGEDLRLMLMTAVSLAVAAIPEGLPAVVTITLALGAQRMLKRHALIRKLPAVEALGSVTVICSDKTGTLTENRMTVTGVITAAEITGNGGDPPDSGLLLTASVLCNDAVLHTVDGQETLVGDPTESALLVRAAAAGVHRSTVNLLFPRLSEIPFDSATKRMVTIHRVSDAAMASQPALQLGLVPGSRLAVAKGASDALLSVCAGYWSDGQVELLDASRRTGITEQVDQLSARGQRVLAVGYRVIPDGEEDPDFAADLDGFIFLGLIAMMDPPRSEARSAVEQCRNAGIRPVMITGDHPLTAGAIAASLGMKGCGRVVTGPELDRIGSAGLAALVDEVSVYARVSPEHKLLIVEALKTRGEVVAMTGDGVNDAPALKTADIGVAMGITGSDVAKESSDMVLLDDNFATIVAAVEEGRTIYDNIRKFIEFSVAGNLGKILAVLLLPFLGLPMPLTPLQLLWLNLLTDGLLGLGMGMERAEPNVMKRPPISPGSQIFDRPMVRHTLLTGGTIGLSVILLTRHFWLQHPDGSWQTMLFTSLAFAQIGQALALRSSSHSLFKIRFFSNPLLLAMITAVLVLQSAVVYLPFLQPFFRTAPLPPDSLAWVVLPGCAVFVVLELEKVVRRSSIYRKKRIGN